MMNIKRTVAFLNRIAADFITWIPFWTLKRNLLRVLGAKIGDYTIIYPNVRFMSVEKKSPFRNISIGESCSIGINTIFDLAGEISVGNKVTIAPNVSIFSHQSAGESPLNRIYLNKTGTTTLKNGVYVGAGAVILCGVTVGENSLIGAGSVVTKDIPANSLAFGVPARVIKRLKL